MADVLHRTTKDFKRSVNTPEYDPATWIINPDLSAVQGVFRKYWKIDGDTVSEMTQAEKDAVDAQEQENLVSSYKMGVGETFQVSFADGRKNIRNRWIPLAGDRGNVSNKTPGVVGWKSKLVGLNWSNDRNSAECQIQVHGLSDNGNSTVKYIADVSSRTLFDHNIQQNIVFEAGEKVAVYIKDVPGNQNDPQRASVVLTFQVLDNTPDTLISNVEGTFRPV